MRQNQNEIPNPEKLMFPGDGITKAALASYYARIAPIMLPLIKRRPLTIQRFPDGIDHDGFFQKHRPDHYPGWILSERMPKENGMVDYLLANSADTLVYLVGQGMVTAHIGLSTVDEPDRPDRMVFDLDPAPGAGFASVRFAAMQLQKLLKRLNLAAFPQTTGSRGIHIIVPIRRELHFDDVRTFALQIARQLADQYPDRLTVAQRKKERRGRLYVDVMRNAYGQTMVAPYAVRAIKGAPVATPLDWAELGRLGGARRYSIRNMFRRLGQKDCPWHDLARHARKLG